MGDFWLENNNRSTQATLAVAIYLIYIYNTIRLGESSQGSTQKQMRHKIGVKPSFESRKKTTRLEILENKE